MNKMKQDEKTQKALHVKRRLIRKLYKSLITYVYIYMHILI